MLPWLILLKMFIAFLWVPFCAVTITATVTNVTIDFLVTMFTLVTKVTNVLTVTTATGFTMVTSVHCLLGFR